MKNCEGNSACGEGEFLKESGESNRQNEVERILPTILEDGDTESVFAKNLQGGFDSQEDSGISGNLGIRGNQSNLSGQLDTDERLSVNAELGGGDDVIMDDLVDVVPGDLIEIGDESGKAGQVQMVKCKCKSGRIQEEAKILMALSPMGD